MGFSSNETKRMLALHGVGKTVIKRLEQLGFSSLTELVGKEPSDITGQIGGLLGSTCWQNSPQAREAIAVIIDLAEKGDAEGELS
jgi:nucleotidyltransferase/DNA polymerase involved in DNA repair